MIHLLSYFPSGKLQLEVIKEGYISVSIVFGSDRYSLTRLKKIVARLRSI